MLFVITKTKNYECLFVLSEMIMLYTTTENISFNASRLRLLYKNYHLKFANEILKAFMKFFHEIFKAILIIFNFCSRIQSELHTILAQVNNAVMINITLYQKKKYTNRFFNFHSLFVARLKLNHFSSVSSCQTSK